MLRFLNQKPKNKTDQLFLKYNNSDKLLIGQKMIVLSLSHSFRYDNVIRSCLRHY